MPKQDTKYSKAWENDNRFKEWIAESNRPSKESRARCKWCISDFSISHGGVSDLIKHTNISKHKQLEKARMTVPSVQAVFCEFFLFEFEIQNNNCDFFFQLALIKN